MHIRKMQKSDFENLKPLFRQVHNIHSQNRPDVYNDIDPLNRDYFDFLINDDKTLTLVCEAENKLVGFCVATFREPSKNPLLKARNVLFVENMCVEDSHRQKGIGKMMLDEITQQAKEKGTDVIELTVWSFNDDAIKFYESCGMTFRSFTMERHLW